MTVSRSKPSPAFLVSLSVLLALLHAIMAVTATRDKSLTSDEIAHLVAGQAYFQRNDYRLQPENGNLPQRLAALPMTVAGIPLPPTDAEAWRTADVWNYGHTFFYKQGVATDWWIFLGRGVISLASAATGLLVFCWSRALFGWKGAFLSLVLFVFCPSFLAHGALTTSDVVMTFFFLAAVGAWWRLLEKPGLLNASISCIVLGLAFVSKISAGLLPPMLAIIGLGWAFGEAKQRGWPFILARLARLTAMHGIATWIIIWAFYGFRYEAFAPAYAAGATFNHGWNWIMVGIGPIGGVIVALKNWHLLPEAWLYGLTFVLQFSRARGAFMNGDYSVTGWASFFPFAFMVKTTIPLLLLLAGGALTAGFAARRSAARERVSQFLRRLRPLLPLAVLFVVYWATSITSHLNIGHRHILPTYPVLFIAAGWLGRWLDFRRPWAMAAIALATAWHVTESVRARPDYLAYFNQIVGGSENGWRHLVDSSLDWGQDLPGLRHWLDTHARRDEPVYVSYFGTGDLTYEGIRATQLPTLPEVGPARPWHGLSPGVYAISATMLQHVYSRIRGPWTAELEEEYLRLRAIEPAFLDYQRDPARRTVLLQETPATQWIAGWKRYEQLRFARLCYYLRVRPADAVIGHSIRIYRLNAAEVAGATQGSIVDWQQLIERAVSGAERR